MADKKKAIKKPTLTRMYITKVRNDKNEVIGWDLKEAKDVNRVVYKTKIQAINTFSQMNIDARAFVSGQTGFEFTILSKKVDGDASIEDIKASKTVFKGKEEVDASALTKEEKPIKTKVKSKTKKIEQKIDFKLSIKLPEEVFGLNEDRINNQVIFDTILSERADRRQGTHKTKGRDEVRGGGRKPWRQKGTGRARAGSIRSPIWVGGGRVFGPTPDRNYTLKVNKKVCRLAKIGAFSRLANHKAIIVEDLTVKDFSTKQFVKKLEDLKVKQLRRVVIVSDNIKVLKSAANIPNVYVRKLNSLSVELLTLADVLILSKENVATLQIQYSNAKGTK